MTPYLCPRCGAELVVGMNFCRQCGNPVTPDASERPTTILQPTAGGPATERPDPRPTGATSVAPLPSGYAAATPGYPVFGVPAVAARSGSTRGLIIVVVIILVLAGLGSVVGVMRSAIISRIHSRATASQPVSKSLVYPGAQTVLNIGSGGGSGVLQLKTADPIDKVADWYEANLKPTKTLRVGPTVIMKTDNVSATIVSDGNNTNILIKQAP